MLINKARKVIKNTFILFSGNIIERIIGFFVTLLLVRYLGVGDFGKFSLIYAFLSFFQLCVANGVDYFILRELSCDYKKGAQLLGNAVTLKIFLSLIGILLCRIILPWMNYASDINMLIYVASLSLLFSFGTLFNNIFQAKSAMEYIVGINVSTKVFLGLCTVTLIFLKAKLPYFIILNLLTYSIQIILAFYLSRRFLSFKIKINLAAWKVIMVNSWPLIINSIFVSIYTRVDQLLLFHIKGNEALGFYAAAVKLIEAPLVIIGAFLASVFPLLSQYAATSGESFKKAYEASFKYLMIFFSLIAMAATLFSRQITLVCYGNNFLPSSVAVAILSWSTLFISFSVMHTFLLLAISLQYLDIVFMSFLAIVNLILNLILIPIYGFMGAAVASLVSYSLVIPLSYSFKKTRMFAAAAIKAMFKPLTVALVTGYLVHSFLPLASIFKLIIAVFIYLLFMLIIKGINSQDFRYLQELLAKSTDADKCLNQ